MAKETGLGDQFYLDGFDLSGDTASLQTISSPVNPLPITGINSSGVERLPGLRSGEIGFTSWFNPDNAHVVLSDLPDVDVLACYFHGQAQDAPAAGLQAKQINYDPTRGADGALSFAVQALSNENPLEWGVQLTAGIDTLAAAGALASIDTGAAQAFGLQAYMQVFAFAGTSATVAIQQSSDDGAVDPFADVPAGVFATTTAAPEAQRLETARDETIEQFLRINVTGTFTDLQFAVLVVKNTTLVEW